MTRERRTSTAPLCRNLFGAVDHEQLSRDLSRRLEEIAERDQRRWNFSFETDEPLDGEYRWEPVPSDRTAAFYQGSAAGEVEVTKEIHVQPSRLEDEESKARLAETNRENISSVSNTLRFPSERTPVRGKRTKASPDHGLISGNQASTLSTHHSCCLLQPMGTRTSTHCVFLFLPDFLVKRRRSSDSRPLKSLGFPCDTLCRGLR